jgi:hypothetical protein
MDIYIWKQQTLGVLTSHPTPSQHRPLGLVKLHFPTHPTQIVQYTIQEKNSIIKDVLTRQDLVYK